MSGFRTRFTRIDDTVLHHRFRPGQLLQRSPEHSRAVVFLNSLGTGLGIWDAVIERLPPAWPVLLMDKRGHGLSQVGTAGVEQFADDAAALMAHHGIDAALVCGVSIGGMIAQALALRHPERVAGLLLSNTAARIGDAAGWQVRLDTLQQEGLEAMADGVLARWFSPSFLRDEPAMVEGYRAMLTRTPPEGYANACRALRDADLRDQAGSITVPTVCLAGGQDAATPPPWVRELAQAIPGALYVELDGIGHLPCIEAPDPVAHHLQQLYERLG